MKLLQGPMTPGCATRSQLGSPDAVAVDRHGDLYIADSWSATVDKVTPAGVISVIAGNGGSGVPVPGPATKTAIGYPGSVAVDRAGNVYIADSQNNVVEKVTPSGRLSIFAGEVGVNGPGRIGPADKTSIGGPDWVAVGPNGDVYIANGEGMQVIKVNRRGQLSLVAGSGLGSPRPGPATSTPLGGRAGQVGCLSGLAVSGSGDVYIADQCVHVVERVSQAGMLSIVAGRVGQNGKPTAGPATSTRLVTPQGLAVDGAGNLYIADTWGGVIERVTPTGALSLVGTAGDNHFQPAALAIAHGQMFVADQEYAVIERLSLRAAAR